MVRVVNVSNVYSDEPEKFDDYPMSMPKLTITEDSELKRNEGRGDQV